MSAIDVSTIRPILKEVYDSDKKKSESENKERFSRIRAALGRKAKRKKSK